MRPAESNAKAVGRGTLANFIKEKPGCSSAPSNSLMEAGMVGSSVGVIVGWGTVVVEELVLVAISVDGITVGVTAG